MITAQLQGGLGNQMFQIAAINALALRNDSEAKFDLSNCHKPSWQGKFASQYQDDIFLNIESCDNIIIHSQYSEPKFSYEKLPYYDKCSYRGYFQSEKYFQDYKQETKALFHIPLDIEKNVKNYLNQLSDKEIVAVHVRRGEYLEFPDIHPTCSIEYYKQSISKFKNCNFIFVSDDIKWCKENFKESNYFYSNFESEVYDLILMKSCNHNIIANSSFSWWSAWLNENINKRIICPSLWFGPKGPQDWQDIYCKEWEII